MCRSVVDVFTPNGLPAATSRRLSASLRASLDAMVGPRVPEGVLTCFQSCSPTLGLVSEAKFSTCDWVEVRSVHNTRAGCFEVCSCTEIYFL